MNPETLAGFGLIAVPIFLSLTLHEYGHARMAMAFGDHTARLMGRVTINPLAHLDWLGTICLFFGPVGWAKPVPVNYLNLRPQRLGDICVSLAGVGMNLLLATFSVAAIHVLAALDVRVSSAPNAPVTPLGVGVFMLVMLFLVNTGLIVFNLLPIFPLDGHHVARELLPRRMQPGFMDFQRRYGLVILAALVILPWLMGRVLNQPVPSPIGWLFGYIQRMELDLLFTGEGRELFRQAYLRYMPLTPWWR